MKQRIGSSVLCIFALIAADSRADEESDMIALATREIAVGPLKLTVGPQEDGEIGAILKGAGSSALEWLNYVPPVTDWGRPFNARYGLIEYDVDAGWSSTPNALNQSSISVKPEVTFIWHTARLPPAQLSLSDSQRKLCGALALRRSDLDTEIQASAADSAKRKVLREQRLTVTKSFQDSKCGATVGEPPKPKWALSVYPDLLYRFGKVNQNGAVVENDQFIVGIAARLFLSSATRSEWFREGPRLSIGYYSVESNRNSTVPVTDESNLDSIKVSARVAMRLPWFGTALRTSPIRFDADLVATRPTTGNDKDWDMMRNLQIAYNTGSEVKPAITYRSGEEQGLQYDKQFILGIVWDLVPGK